MPSQDHPVILFDGLCTLCDASVQMVLDLDTDERFRFASLQSPIGRQLAGDHGVDSSRLDTLVLVDGNRAFVESTAVLGIARRLGAPWSWMAVFTLIPLPLRDAAYRFVARNRTRWFGQRTSCRIPTPEIRARFLDL